ncbi:hypothetical protein [Rhodococcus erythropolis]|nr:hypothetical protein QV65_04805 [Rhodococcus erythropolis]
MPTIDIYATAGTFVDKHQLAQRLATVLMGMCRTSMVRAAYVRVQVLTNAGALDRDKPLEVVSNFS